MIIPLPGVVYVIRPASRLGLLVSLVEAYDGLAVVRTKDAAAGIVEFWISPFMQQDFESFLSAAKQELGVVAGSPVISDVNTPGFPDAL